jgi:hypothetical protein
MFCTDCGNKIDGGIKFCTSCGMGVSNEPEGNIHLKKSNLKKIISKIIIGLVVVFFLYLIFSIDSSPKEKSNYSSLNEINQSVLISSVVNILCEDDNGDISGGSGTIITEEGIILTNSHVIPQDEDYVLTGDYGCLVTIPNQQTGQPEEIYWAQPLVIPGLSDDYDLAYFEIYDVFTDEDGEIWGRFPNVFKGIFSEEYKHDEICQYDTDNLGDKIRIFGYPKSSGGYSLTITEGILSSFSDGGIILTSAKIDAGNSGGLAVDEKGCMVGVPVAVVEGKYQNMGVIIPTNLILEFSEKLEELQD